MEVNQNKILITGNCYVTFSAEKLKLSAMLNHKKVWLKKIVC